MARLTGKQEAFIRAYIGPADFNATAAARMAGYSGDDATLAAMGCENLKKPKIRSEIDKRLDEQLPSNSELLTRLSDIAMGLDEDASPRDRRMAIRDLLELRGEYIQRVEVTSGDDKLIQKMDQLFGLIETDDHEKGTDA